MEHLASKRLSCGIVIVNDHCELLLCHVTGQNHWDLPKGGIEIGESPVQAALRETREETGLHLDSAYLVELGRFAYTTKKDLHLFAALTSRFSLALLRCESREKIRASHKTAGKCGCEMDGFGWFSFERVAALCTPKMALVLIDKLDLPDVLHTLVSARRQDDSLAA
jgi:putative (di)nucleoside polyphosphate hydrolase